MNQIEGRKHPNEAWDPFVLVYKGEHVLMSPDRVVRVLYKNWKGEVAWRRIIFLPTPIEFTGTPHHPTPQWIVRVWDMDKRAERSYAIKDMLKMIPGDGDTSGLEIYAGP